MKTANTLGTGCSLSLLALALVAGSAFAQATKTDLGKQEYVDNCAVCHGNDGKGNGPYREMLQKGAPDLTKMTKNNGGMFPVAKMFETIEGANVPGHGTREMPIWGHAYRMRAAEYYMDSDYNPEVYVRARILALIEYLSRMQER